MTITAQPYSLHSEILDKFIDLLNSPKRRLPIVLLSPYANGDSSQLDAEEISKRLAGVATVVRIEDVDVTWEFADIVGRALSCFDGAARIYWPGFSSSDDPRSHQLYLGATIRSVGAPSIGRAIERAIFSVASFRFVPDARLSEVISTVEEKRRQQRLTEQKADSGIDWEDIANSFDKDLAKAKQRIVELEAENGNLRENQKILFAAPAPGESAVDEAVEDDPPSSVEVACERAKSMEHLTILDSAMDAARQSPFVRPVEIFEALRSLNEMAGQPSGGDILAQLRQRGWGKRASMHISDTTKSKYGKSYKFDYDGANQYFEPHITLGSGDANSCASIHFIFDHKKGKCVIAHVGRHLPNTKT